MTEPREDDASQDIELAFSDRESFLEFASRRPGMFDRGRIDEMANWIRAQGFLQTRRFGPSPVSIVSDNYREGVQALGMPCRCFALLDLLDEAVGKNPAASILCLEGLTAFARIIRTLYPRSICTEYAPDPVDQRRIAPIPHVDAQDMPFADATFDAMISADVFEHVPDLPRVLGESRRVLREGGALISTFPFAAGSATEIRKATLENGAIRHLVEPPEYHGDPVRPDQGVLVFQIPGWNILDDCRAAGFSTAEMVYISDRRRGLIGNGMDGQLTLRALA